MYWRIHAIRMTRVLHSSQGLQVCCNHLHKAWGCSYLAPAECHIVPLHECYISDAALSPYMFSFEMLSINTIQSLLWIHCLPLNLHCYYRILQVWIIYCRILTLSSTMPWILHILCWCIIGLRCFFLLIRIRIVAILAIISVDITGSKVQPIIPSVLHILRWSIIGLQCLFLHICFHIIASLDLIPVDITGSQDPALEFIRGPSSPAGGGDDLTFITFMLIIAAAPWHADMQFVIRAIVVYRDVWVSASDLRVLKRPFGGQIVNRDRIVSTHCTRADDHGRHRVLRLLDLMVDCRKSVFIHPLLVALWECVPGIHQECIRVCNARQG